jgi:hypothetical protein
MSIPRLLTAWRRRRAWRRIQQRRIAEAEQAARDAAQTWPVVEQAADVARGFEVEMRRAMRRPARGGP